MLPGRRQDRNKCHVHPRGRRTNQKRSRKKCTSLGHAVKGSTYPPHPTGAPAGHGSANRDKASSSATGGLLAMAWLAQRLAFWSRVAICVRTTEACRAPSWASIAVCTVSKELMIVSGLRNANVTYLAKQGQTRSMPDHSHTDSCTRMARTTKRRMLCNYRNSMSSSY